MTTTDQFGLNLCKRSEAKLIKRMDRCNESAADEVLVGQERIHSTSSPSPDENADQCEAMHWIRWMSPGDSVL
jgi:hypothetical protein